jgi:phosphatidylglycerol---prolipoprotein diacylglyceryl transferase
MIEFFHNFSPNPVLFQFGPLIVRYYGLIIALALFLAVLLGLKLAKKAGFTADEVFDLSFWLALVGLIGARLYEVLILEPGYFLSHLSEIVKIWHGGLAIHGAIIGGVIALLVWCRRNKKDFWLTADIIAVVLPLAQALGRWGNYFNQEVFGRPTNLPWGIFITPTNRPAGFSENQYFHPTFLYESVLNLILFLILFIVYRKNKLKKGQYLAVYLIGYGVIRFLMEFIRIDQTAMILGLRWPQIFSLILIMIGAIIFYKKK